MVEKSNPIYKKIRAKLKHAGYKLTPQREITVETIVENNSGLLTAEELFVAVKTKNSSIGLATVYRTLDILFELEVVRKISLRDGLSRYELIKNEDEFQSFVLLCVQCGSIKEIKEKIFEDIKIQIENKYRFKINTHQISFHGTCEVCQENGMVQSE